MQDEKEIAVDETVAQSPQTERLPSGRPVTTPNGGASLAETLESTGDETIAEHRRFAKGSRDDRHLSAKEVAAAPTLAAGSADRSAALSSSQQESDGKQPVVLPGSHLGRLEIGETLGSGAFGVVVAAYDPDLKRKLAVKILRPEVFDSTGGKDAQKRLMREARAMARISHPNVVTVHDIGTVEGQVFVAMEFVAGQHLRHWLGAEERSWQEILATFEQAGRGLSAAHQAGLVHRDFKPDNVLVSDRGDVRVADFGLVSISSQKKDKAVSAQFAVPRSNSDELGITRVGAVMGTALYMAPEQHRGHDAGPGADQFSFCVALYWALYKQLPFEGENYEELRDNVLAGRLVPAPSDTAIPKWILPVLEHGMATDPASRHRDMDTLLTALGHDPTIKRNSRLKMAAVVLAGAGAFGGFYMTRPAAASVCQNAAERLQGTWDATAKERIAGVYSTAKRAEGFGRLAGAVDRYTDNWVSVRTRVCEATHFVGDQSESLLDLRMNCLDQRLGYLGELMGQLEAGTKGAMLDKAVTAAMSLPALDSCTVGTSVASEVPLPTDLQERESIERIRNAVDKAQALSDLGEPAEAATILHEAMGHPVDFAPVMGDASNLLGKVLSDLGELEESEVMLHKSIEHATAAGDDMLVASSWLALTHIEGVEREKYESGYDMVRMAKLAMVRGKASAYTLAKAEKAKAMILMREGKAEESIQLLQSLLPAFEESASESELAFFLAALGDAKAGDSQYQEAVVDYKLSLAHLESVLGAEHLENVYVLNNLAVALKNTGELGEARDALERSLSIVERTHGKVHRNVVTILINMGNFARREGDFEEAKAVFARAISVGNEVLEDGHPSVTKAIMNLGIVMAAEGDFEGATGRFKTVLERARKSFDGDHPDVAMALNNVGESLSLEEKHEEGLAYVTEAMQMKGRLYGTDHPKSASSIATVGTINAALGRVPEAETHLKRALAIFEAAAGPKHPRSIKMLRELGKLHMGENAAKKALPFLRSVVERMGDDASLAVGQDRLALAQALWAAGERGAARVEETALSAVIGNLDGAEELEGALRKWQQSR